MMIFFVFEIWREDGNFTVIFMRRKNLLFSKNSKI